MNKEISCKGLFAQNAEKRGPQKTKTRTSRGGQQRSITKEKKREDMDTFAQARMFGHSNKNKFVDTNFNDWCFFSLHEKSMIGVSALM